MNHVCMNIINSSKIQNYLYDKSILSQVIQCRECTIIGFLIFLVLGAEHAFPLVLPVNILLDPALFPRNAG